MKKYARFIFGLGRFLRGRIPTEQAIALAKRILKDRVQRREENFLNLVEKGVFGYENSPYRLLLDPKKIRYADIKERVGRGGLESAMTWLQEEGVYFTVEEYKGKTDVSRNGRTFRLTEK